MRHLFSKHEKIDGLAKYDGEMRWVTTVHHDRLINIDDRRTAENSGEEHFESIDETLFDKEINIHQLQAQVNDLVPERN